VNPDEIKATWDYDVLYNNSKLLSTLEKEGLLSISSTCLKLTPKGLFMADGIASDLFISEDDEILNT
jgi:coproporphyrinogen III oxidase-like Fe-S oxidoreductase